MDTIQHNGKDRTFKVHTPPSYDGSDETPLVLALHGAGGSAAGMEALSELSQKADGSGFIVVYPEGVKSNMGNRTWNAGKCCGYAMYQGIDDVGFIDALLDSLQADFNIDSDRIYSAGLSNGGYMSYRLACELSDRIAAIAPVAATMNVNSCNPQREVPVIHIHSYEDSVVPYQGGMGGTTYYNPSLDSVLNAWGTMNGCSVMADTVHDSGDYDHVRWEDCSCKKDISLFMTHDGGHSWPGGDPTWNVDPVSNAIDANDRIWSFFQANPFPCNASSLEEAEGKGAVIDLYPNPVSEKLQFRASERMSAFRILDASGRAVMHEKGMDAKRRSLSVSELDGGLYILQVTDEDGRRTVRKFLKEE